jgi:hypothetical protein
MTDMIFVLCGLWDLRGLLFQIQTTKTSGAAKQSDSFVYGVLFATIQPLATGRPGSVIHSLHEPA